MYFEEKTLESQMIYRGQILNLRKDKVTVIHGTSYREIVEHNGGAAIIPIKEDGNVIMVKQYRKAAKGVVLEVPAGKVDPGEEPLTTAVRELKEETGYSAKNMDFLTEYLPSPGYTEEILYLYMATGLTAGETDYDENEAIELVEYPIDLLFDMVMKGEIRDGKSQVAILMAHNLYHSGLER